MHALRLHHPGPLAPNSLVPADLPPLPDPESGWVRLRVVACAVCRTDLHLIEGDLPAHRLPLVPGHQVIGVVEQAGQGVARWRVGDQVGVPWLHTTCGECDPCRRGQENLCTQARFTGWDVDGGYAEAMLAHETALVHLPEGLDGAQAAPLLCAGVIGYRSLRLAEVQPGERLGLFGFGASAHLALQVARYWDCPTAVFTRGAAHRDLALRLGAAWAGESGWPPPWPLDRAVLFAPSGALVPAALRALRPGGTLAINAIHLSPIPEMDYGLLYGERTLRSVTNLTRRDADEFMQLAARIPVHSAVEVFPLAEAYAALERLKGGRLVGAAVLVP